MRFQVLLVVTQVLERKSFTMVWFVELSSFAVSYREVVGVRTPPIRDRNSR